ncbi:P-loop containing nucleoside triphosphate hydrolase protein [Epithele typhae]|uniref:P-loop containing nucleoside triphosphate hydrolase protein n=1 Tax=Epithele typhae TaxID=378194 RepID=UPI002007931D|nr:P-loop containing nucleoside triphosphate hydrolase protein [Epithele typhae]KAH9944979.1 P-loop containing nucleoside triphosphate hydrolase protein [Epithele typhae]
MRLQQLSPPLDPAFVALLAEINVRTDTDLLLGADSTQLFARLPDGHGLSLRAFRDHVQHATTLAAAQPEFGDAVFAREQALKADAQFAEDPEVGTGIPALDELLGGGFAPPVVVEVSGDTGSGKTARTSPLTLALQVAARHLARARSSSVLWIDTSSEFAPERVARMLDALGGPHVETALDRLQVSLAFDLDAVHALLEALRQALAAAPHRRAASPEYDARAPDDDAARPPRVLVLDAATPLLGPLLSATSSHGHAVMATLMRQLREFARAFALTVLIVNGASRVAPKDPAATNPEAAFATGRKPALGPSFTFMADATVWLSRREREGVQEDGGTVHVAEVLRSRAVTSKTWAPFKILDGVMVPL